MHTGIDLGGTKIEAIALDGQGREVFRQREATPADSYANILAVIANLVAAIDARFECSATVGIGTPGAISPSSGLMRNSNTVCLNGRALDRDIAERLQRPIVLANDANCFALSEATDGAGAGAGVVFGVIIGTGTGAGVVVDGRVLGGPNAIAGEWGHNPLPWPRDDERPGGQCYCGKTGCLETWLSGPGLVADFSRTAQATATPPELVARADQGDRVAQAVLARYEDRLARGLAAVINVLDPDVIVLGGGLSNITRLYNNVPGLLERYVFSDAVDTRLCQAMHGDSSGVRGAAWLGREAAQ